MGWSSVEGADYYTVYYNTSNNPATASEVPSAMDSNNTDTAATITGLTDGSLYYIWVSASNSAGSSAKSAGSKSVPVPDSASTDHNGADFIIPADAPLSGTHYNVGLFKVESGVTVSVSPYDGSSSETGMLTVYAESVEIAGVIDAEGAGYGGGGGGGGGAGGSFITGPNGNTGSGGGEVQGGASGANGNYAWGTNNIHGGAGGDGGSGGGSGGGAGGTGGGAGTGGSAADNGEIGGTGAAGDDALYNNNLNTPSGTVVMGSGGGGAGGGGGGGGLNVEVASCWGGGGAGGGAGGSGGGAVVLYSFGSLSISGEILTRGISGFSGQTTVFESFQSGSSGGNSAGSASGRPGDHGGGQEANGHQPSRGGSAMNGGAGSGGGILLKGTDVYLSGAVIDCSGGSGNPGEIKIFHSNILSNGTYLGDTDPDIEPY